MGKVVSAYPTREEIRVQAKEIANRYHSTAPIIWRTIKDYKGIARTRYQVLSPTHFERQGVPREWNICEYVEPDKK